MTSPKLRKWTAIFFLVLLINAAYVWAFAFPTVFYMTNVLFHLGLGTVLFVALSYLVVRDAALRNRIASAFGFFLLAFLLGAYLTGAGNTLDHRWALWSHIVAAVVGTLALVPYVWRRARLEGGNWLRFRNALVACIGLLLLLPASVTTYQRTFPSPEDRIRNPLNAPLAMTEEGGGPKSPFFPSSART